MDAMQSKNSLLSSLLPPSVRRWLAAELTAWSMTSPAAEPLINYLTDAGQLFPEACRRGQSSLLTLQESERKAASCPERSASNIPGRFIMS